MTYSLRNKKNEIIIEADIKDDNLFTTVNVREYSTILLTRSHAQAMFDLIDDFSALDELNGEWHETDHGYDDMNRFIEDRLKAVGDKHGLIYCVD